ncbi:MAG TPA: amino-acid N-acetyltransferase [Chitinivibrionales bacterium]|nr:amino-acid N-acetyltransferase [Chitinivibrionales bacterium]
MDKKQLKQQVETIRQAFSYIKRFRGETFVIKIEGSLLSHPFFPGLIKDIALLHHMGIRVALVPGAKERIDEILNKYNIGFETVKGIRISTPESIPFIKMAAFDVSNKVMTMLAENNTNAVIGNWVKARSIGVRGGVDFQSTGIVETLQTGIIQNVLTDGLVPIFPNIGWNAQGKPYNISSNELAFTISTELKAAKLFFVTETGGIHTKGFTVPKSVYVSSDGVISQFTLAEAEQFVSTNEPSAKPEYELVSLACRACKSGVARVHIIDGHLEGMLLKEIFSNRGLGTMIYANQHENIRAMNHADVPEVLQLMAPYIAKGTLIQRTASDLEERLADYAVYEVDGTVHACGALHVYPGHQAEIAGIAVDELYESLGIGMKMVSYLVEKAHGLKLKQVFVLTTQTSDWFSLHGFKKADVKALPPERQATYDKKRNSLVLIYRISQARKGHFVE